MENRNKRGEGRCVQDSGLALSSTWSHISDLISEVEADGATEEEFCDALDKSTDSSVA